MIMEEALLWTFSVFFGFWLLLTLAGVGGRRSLAWFRVPRVLWAFIPNWNLFAPKPGIADYYVMYRDQSGEAEPGPWQRAYAPEARKWSHGIWNPNKVQAKAVFDLVQQLATVIMEMKEGGEDGLMQSAPYLHLLHFVRHLPREESHDRTQFAIIVAEPANQYEATMLVSPYYPL